MQKRYFFLAGLPRSGSTLLCNILMQNPEVYASATSGLAEIVVPVRTGWQRVTSLRAMPSEDMYQRLRGTLFGIIQGYYSSVAYPIVIDKSRAWLRHVPMLEEVLGEKAKIITTVRDLPQVFASIEKLWRKNSALGITSQELANPAAFVDVKSRVQFFAAADQLVGSSLNNIKNALQCGWGDRMHLVEYKQLCQSPKATLEGIYNFLEIPQFEHDFEQVEQVTREDDRAYNWLGLHDIRPKVEYPKPDYNEVLGKQLAASLAGQEEWRH